jgi:hypothetical protein
MPIMLCSRIVAKEKALSHKIEFADIHFVFTDPADLRETKFIPARLGTTRWLPSGIRY